MPDDRPEEDDPTPEDVKLSPEVAWYLEDRGIPRPARWQVPMVKTPEPDGSGGELFDPERVDKVLRSFRALRHTQGKWAGRPLNPDPWQVAYIIAPVFGWVRWSEEHEQYVRVFQDVYVDVPRKNGKSTIAGGIAIYLTCADGEAGAQVVAAATSRDQASFVFDPVKKLAEESPALRRHTKVRQSRIIHPSSGSFFRVVAKTAEAQHGANLHGAVVDELHVHKSPDLVETIETGRGSRTQPLVLIITTADDGKPGTIYERRRTRVERIAKGTIEEPTVYGVIWGVDRDADPFVEETWMRANPGYGVSPTRGYIQKAAANAANDPAALATFQRLHLGIRTKQTTRYITLEEWDRNRGFVDELKLKGAVAYGGLDLGNVADLTSLCWLFPDGRGEYDAVWRFWLPEDVVPKLRDRTGGSLEAWIREGWVRTTPGATTDYDYVLAQMKRDRKAFQVKEVGFDPWNANQVTKQLQAERAPLVEVRQGYATMSPALKECKRILASGTAETPLLRSGSNPVMRWMTDNLVVAMDAAGNVKPDKANAADKIDGWSALVTAMSRAMHYRVRRSRYADSSSGAAEGA